MIKELNLRRPIYSEFSNFGFFGRKESFCTWEYPKNDLKIKQNGLKMNGINGNIWNLKDKT